MNHIKFSDNLNLVLAGVPKQPSVNAVPKPLGTNFVFVMDVSWSMSSELRRVREAFRNYVERFVDKNSVNTVSAAYYSGEGGQYRFFLNGFTLHTDEDKRKLYDLTDKHLKPIGTTCFSEVTKELGEVVEDLHDMNGFPVNIVFYTDGHPVVSGSTAAEMQITLQNCKHASKHISTSLVVGFGYGYNKKFLADMVQNLGGGIVAHVDDAVEFEAETMEFGNKADGLLSRVDMVVPASGYAFYEYGLKLFMIGKVEKGHEVKVPAEGVEYLCVVSEEKMGKVMGIKNVVGENPVPLGNHDYQRYAYGAALMLNKFTRTDLAVAIMGKVRDKQMVDTLNRAFTLEEHAVAESMLESKMTKQHERFTEGESKANYVPRADEFCVLDLINLLQEDDMYNLFYPREVAYKRIGQAHDSMVSATFKPYSNQGYSFADLNWHSKRLNLSLRYKERGAVPISDEHRPVVQMVEVPTYRWRNMTIIKDGVLHVKELPVTLGAGTFDKLKATKLIRANTKYDPNKMYVLKLSKIPLVNKKILNSDIKSGDYARMVYLETGLKAMAKVYRHYMGLYQEPTVDKSIAQMYGAKAAELLQTEYYITSKGFNPPTQARKSSDGVSDEYLAKVFESYLDKVSSLPKVQDVVNKITDGKNLTPRESLMEEAIRICLKEEVATRDRKSAYDTFASEYEKVKKDRKLIGYEITMAKFALMMGNRWFSDLDSREVKVVVPDYEDKSVKIKLHEQVVKV